MATLRIAIVGLPEQTLEAVGVSYDSETGVASAERDGVIVAQMAVTSHSGSKYRGTVLYSIGAVEWEVIQPSKGIKR